jgi:predicted dehydrogenase
MPEVELVALADPIQERVAKFGDQFHVPRLYKNHKELCADPNIDVVCVCTPSGMHADHAVEAMRHGKHAIVEKPIEVSLEAADRMIRTADEMDRKLTVISQHRFDPASMLVKDAIDSGKLGRIILATGQVKWWREQTYYDSGDWRGTWALDGGGALVNQGVHTVDVLQWLVGGVRSVFGHTKTGAHERIETEDIAVAALNFKCGAVGTLTATTAAYPGFPVKIEIYGTEGSAILEGDRLKSMTLRNGQTFASEEAAAHAISVAQGGTASVKDQEPLNIPGKKSGWGEAHAAQFRDLIRAVRHGGQPLIDGRSARHPLEIVLGVYESARTGRAIDLVDG